MKLNADKKAMESVPQSIETEKHVVTEKDERQGSKMGCF